MSDQKATTPPSTGIIPADADVRRGNSREEPAVTDRDRELADSFIHQHALNTPAVMGRMTRALSLLLAQARREGREEGQTHCGHHFALRAADALARAVDEAVKSGYVSACSKIADARLDYGEPYKYEHTPEPQPAPEGAEE